MHRKFFKNSASLFIQQPFSNGKELLNKQKYYTDFWTCLACYITIQQMEKALDEVEAKVIRRFDR